MATMRGVPFTLALGVAAPLCWGVFAARPPSVVCLQLSGAMPTIKGARWADSAKKRTPGPAFAEPGVNSGNDLLSHKLYKHYHRSCGVSLPCSEWERVGPPRKDHQTMGI